MSDLKAEGLLKAENFLEQFGTKGMRWGVRKQSNNIDSAVKGANKLQAKADRAYNSKLKNNKDYHKDANGSYVLKRRPNESQDSFAAREKLSIAKTSGLRALDNEGIKEVNTRLQLEKKYSELTYVQKKTAADKIKAVISGTKKANDISKKLTNKGLIQHIEALTGIKVPGAPKAPPSTSTSGSKKSKVNPFKVQAEFNKAFDKKPKQIEGDEIVVTWNPKTEVYE